MTTNINLLPWREQLREEQKIQFLWILGLSVLAVLLLVAFIHIFYANKISQQNRSNIVLTAEIKQLNQQIESIQNLKRQRAAMIGRMNIIQSLQQNRQRIVHIFDELVNVLPSGVSLKKVEVNPSEITLIGNAESNTNVSLLMRSISLSPWVGEPKLTEIKASPLAEGEADFALKIISRNTHNQLTKKEDGKIRE